MGRAHFVVFAVAVLAGIGALGSACSSSVELDEGGPPHDAGMDGRGADDGGDAGPFTMACGGTTCAVGSLCCYTTMRCFDPATERSACPVPDGGAGGCASNADCPAGEECDWSTDLTRDGPIPSTPCTGIGVCVAPIPTTACGMAFPGLCGCDGRSYRSRCAAAAAGVRVASMTACGQTGVWPTACATSDQCPTGQTCCALLSVCVDATRPSLCRAIPPATTYPCDTDADCAFLMLHSAPGTIAVYCDGPGGCGTPGGCRWPQSDCGGELSSVCGCDGTSYSNACWASHAGTRVAHDGMCP